MAPVPPPAPESSPVPDHGNGCPRTCFALTGKPWGSFEVLASETLYKVKRIVVLPRHRLSLQRHQKRTEHWYVVEGEGVVTLESLEFPVRKGVDIDIPRGSSHRIANTGPRNLVYIEVQLGDYFGEDDIERLEDDYGRGGIRG